MEQVTNTFGSGLQMDTHPMQQGQDTLTDALNATFITMNGNEIVLQNDMGNAPVQNTYLPQGYMPVGMKEYGGVIYIAAYNPILDRSQIGSFPSPQRRFFNLSTDDSCEFNPSVFFDEENIENIIKRKVLIPLKQDQLFRAGDKFVLYFVKDGNITQFLSNYNNVDNNGKVKSPKNNYYTLSLGIMNSKNEFVDITKDLLRFNRYGNIITFDENNSDLYKFNSGYFIAPELSDSDESDYTETLDDSALEQARKLDTLKLNTYGYKLVGTPYIKAELNLPTDFDYSISGYNIGTTRYHIDINYILKYNCPDGINYEHGDSDDEGDYNYNKYLDDKDVSKFFGLDFQWYYNNINEFPKKSIGQSVNKSTSNSKYDPITNTYSTILNYSFQLIDSSNKKLINYNIIPTIKFPTSIVKYTDTLRKDDGNCPISDYSFCVGESGSQISQIHRCVELKSGQTKVFTYSNNYKFASIMNCTDEDYFSGATLIESQENYEIVKTENEIKITNNGGYEYLVYLIPVNFSGEVEVSYYDPNNITYNYSIKKILDLQQSGTLDLSQLASGKMELTGWRFYNDFDNEETAVTVNFESYPKPNQEFYDLTFDIYEIDKYVEDSSDSDDYQDFLRNNCTFVKTIQPDLGNIGYNGTLDFVIPWNETTPTSLNFNKKIYKKQPYSGGESFNITLFSSNPNRVKEGSTIFEISPSRGFQGLYKINNDSLEQMNKSENSDIYDIDNGSFGLSVIQNSNSFRLKVSVENINEEYNNIKYLTLFKYKQSSGYDRSLVNNYLLVITDDIYNENSVIINIEGVEKTFEKYDSKILDFTKAEIIEIPSTESNDDITWFIYNDSPEDPNNIIYYSTKYNIYFRNTDADESIDIIDDSQNVSLLSTQSNVEQINGQQIILGTHFTTNIVSMSEQKMYQVLISWKSRSFNEGTGEYTDDSKDYDLRWLLTTELFNNSYYNGNPYFIKDFCNPKTESEIKVYNDLTTIVSKITNDSTYKVQELKENVNTDQADLKENYITLQNPSSNSYNYTLNAIMSLYGTIDFDIDEELYPINQKYMNLEYPQLWVSYADDESDFESSPKPTKYIIDRNNDGKYYFQLYPEESDDDDNISFKWDQKTYGDVRFVKLKDAEDIESVSIGIAMHRRFRDCRMWVNVYKGDNLASDHNGKGANRNNMGQFTDYTYVPGQSKTQIYYKYRKKSDITTTFSTEIEQNLYEYLNIHGDLGLVQGWFPYGKANNFKKGGLSWVKKESSEDWIAINLKNVNNTFDNVYCYKPTPGDTPYWCLMYDGEDKYIESKKVIKYGIRTTNNS